MWLIGFLKNIRTVCIGEAWSKNVWGTIVFENWSGKFYMEFLQNWSIIIKKSQKIFWRDNIFETNGFLQRYFEEKVGALALRSSPDASPVTVCHNVTIILSSIALSFFLTVNGVFIEHLNRISELCPAAWPGTVQRRLACDNEYLVSVLVWWRELSEIFGRCTFWNSDFLRRKNSGDLFQNASLRALGWTFKF